MLETSWKGRLRRTTENARVSTRRPITGREPRADSLLFHLRRDSRVDKVAERTETDAAFARVRNYLNSPGRGQDCEPSRYKIGQLEMRLRRGERRTLRAMLALPTAEAQESSDRLTDRHGPEPAPEGLGALRVEQARELKAGAAALGRAGLKFQELGRDRANRLDQALEGLSVESVDLHPIAVSQMAEFARDAGR